METVFRLIAVLLVIIAVVKAERAVSIIVAFTISVLLVIYLTLHM